MQPPKFRAHCLGVLMTEPKAKSEKLSAGAKTFLGAMAKEIVYGYDQQVSSKYLEKGIAVEEQSIALYNEARFTNYVKNTQRLSNEWIQGEADIVTPNRIIDIKSSWSLPTFPATAADAYDKDYEWQVRAYMWLYDKPEAEVAHCLVSTPDDLIGYESEDLHYVDHIDPALRITSVYFTRDTKKEERIKEKVIAAREYLDYAIKQIALEHA